MTRELYSKSGDTVHYWTRDELLARAERAEAERDEARSGRLVATIEAQRDRLRSALAVAVAAELGRAGGSATSEAKRRAARANGRRGGRPRKSNT